MKSAVTIIALISFVGIALFGALAMHHSQEQGHGGCLASSAQGLADCPDTGNFWSFVVFHLAGIKSFSTAIVTALSVALLPAVLIVLAGLLDLVVPPLLSSGAVYALKQRQRTSKEFPWHRRWHHWLALRNAGEPALSY